MLIKGCLNICKRVNFTLFLWKGGALMQLTNVFRNLFFIVLLIIFSAVPLWAGSSDTQIVIPYCG